MKRYATHDIQVARLTAAIFATPPERALSWLAGACWRRNEDSGPWFHLGIAADEARCWIGRLRARRMVRRWERGHR